MQCFCCGRDGLTSARKAKARELFDNGPVGDGKESAAYKAHREQSAYRWRVICQACYSLMDNRLLGDAWIVGRWFSLEGISGATGPRPSTRSSTGRGSGGRPRSSGWTCKTRPDRRSANFAARLFPRESRSRMQTGGFLLFSGRAGRYRCAVEVNAPE